MTPDQFQVEATYRVTLSLARHLPGITVGELKRVERALRDKHNPPIASLKT
ncbi:MAG: hypothetical protein MSC45_07045 [Mobiluncus sp.]|uniref:SHOCT domain-containing protein n=1 Tax=Mobiluncus sp. TaxID=47293 RepID=UPI002587A88D|nr:SHOCT domain-containing protein [Mobiluncus sp.]MCI6584806.1 hypothetical protein [Mobiluncus sp.]